MRETKFKVEVKEWFGDAVREAAKATEKAINNGLSMVSGRKAIQNYVNEMLPEAIEISTVKKEEISNE